MNQEKSSLSQKMKDGLTGFTDVLNQLKILLVALLAVVVAFFAFYDGLKQRFFPEKETGKNEIIKIQALKPLKEKELRTDHIRLFQDKTIILETLPLYLENSDLRNSFFWLHVKAENFSDKTLTMVIRLVKVHGVIVDTKTMEYHATIAPHQKNFSQQYRPEYDILSADTINSQASMDNSVTLEVTVREKDSNRQIHKGQYNVKGLRVNEFKWGLRTVDGKKVPPVDLIASLTAWSTVKNPELHQYREELKKHAMQKSSLGSKLTPCPVTVNYFFEKLYNDIIKKSFIVTGKPVFEDSEVTAIQRPQSVLKELKENAAANALETGLLIGALTKDCASKLKIPITLLIQFGDEGDNYIVAWSVSKNGKMWKGQGWEGFSITNNDGSYDENKKNSKIVIETILDGHPGLLDYLNKRGAYFKDSKVAALYYYRAAEEHHIHGLP